MYVSRAEWNSHERARISANAEKGQILTLCRVILVCLFGALNNLGASMVSKTMPVYPAFCLYLPSFIYTIFLWLLAFALGERPLSSPNYTRKFQKHYVILAAISSANAILFQFSAAAVSGGVTQVISNLVLVWIPILEIKVFPQRKLNYTNRASRVKIKWRLLVALVLMAIGIVIGLLDIHTQEENETTWTWIWTGVMVASTVFAALQQVSQDYAFRSTEDGIDEKNQIKPFTCLAWYNLYSIIPLVLSSFLECIKGVNGGDWKEFHEAIDNQVQAFNCFITSSGDNCHGIPWLWNLLFSIGYTGMYGVNALLIRSYGCLYPNLLVPIMALLSAIIFMIPDFLGVPTAFSYFPIIGLCIIIVGILVFGVPARERQESVMLQ